MQWKYLTLDNLSYKTVNKYFNLWSKKNIFSKSYYNLLAFLQKDGHERGEGQAGEGDTDCQDEEVPS